MFNRIVKWWQFVLLHLQVRKIAFSAMSDTWPKVRIKVAGLPAFAACEYVGRHSAAVVHRRVELLVRQNPAIDASTANVLIVKASSQLSRQLMRKVTRQYRTTRRAA